MSNFTLEAETRTNTGKGASRRLRRLEGLVPAIIYGGDKKPAAITLNHHKITKILEDERIFSSIFDLKIDGQAESVILRDIHRHPFKPLIMHMDFQRVSQKDILVRNVPIHFINEQNAKAVKSGGIVTHTMTQVEVRCLAKNLPECIEVDLSSLVMDQVLHLSDLKLPANIELTADLSDGTHNLPVVSVHAPRAQAAEASAETTEEKKPEEE